MAYPENFRIANAFTQKWEKGYVNHPNDPGGATYNGVSLRFLKQTKTDINGDGLIDAADIRALYERKDQARVDEIFFKAFWRDPNLDQFGAASVQTALYDANVNTGRTQAAKFLQRAINAHAGMALLAIDGKIGPKTLAAYRGILEIKSPLDLALSVVAFRIDFHDLLADNSPYPDGRDYRPFIKGWRNRCLDLRAYLKTLA